MKRKQIKNKCGCGCGKFTKWNKTKIRYNTYIQHHHCIGRKLSTRHKEILSASRKGIERSDLVKLKISNSLKGRYVGEKSFRFGKKHTDEAKRKLSLGRIGRFYGKDSPMYGKIFSEETKQKMSMSAKNKLKNKKNHPMFGKTHSMESRKKISLNHIDCAKEKNSQWKGGKSFEPYGIEFDEKLKELIRERDNYCCQLCSEKQKNRRLCIHHIDYDKQNNDPKNLISLCLNCHLKTNVNRDNWTEFFKASKAIFLSGVQKEGALYV
tara:strand:+ start:7160 stop:7957 length:798 start_codon:yes stop_codon:yes gene_type:complete